MQDGDIAVIRRPIGKEFNDRKKAGEKISEILQKNSSRLLNSEMDVGEYRGMKLSLLYDPLTKINKACLIGEKRHYCDIGNISDSHKIASLDNVIKNIEKTIEKLTLENETLKSDFERMKIDVEKPFENADELAKLEARLEEVQLELSNSNIVDDSLCKEVFYRLMDMFPQVLTGETEYLKLKSEGFEDLNVSIYDNLLTLCHTYIQNGDLMYDPRIVLTVDYENEKVVPIFFEQSGFTYKEFDENILSEEMFDVLEFMNDTWLDNIENQGFLKNELGLEIDDEVR